MNYKVLALGAIELALSIVIGIFVLWATYQIIKLVVAPKMEIKPNNAAFAVFAAAVMLSVGLIMSESISPAMNAYRLEVQQAQSIQFSALHFIKILSMYLLIGLISAGIINLISVWLYNILTREVDELTEIRNGNLATAIITAVIILVITLMAKNSLSIIFESFIPYPQTPRFY